MDLWIRSQDREMLKQASVLYVADDGEEGFSIKHYGVRFGVYNTKERALEILDEIQTFIEKQGTCEATSNEVGIINGIQVFGNVYEMPKE